MRVVSVVGVEVMVAAEEPCQVLRKLGIGDTGDRVGRKRLDVLDEIMRSGRRLRVQKEGAGVTSASHVPLLSSSIDEAGNHRTFTKHVHF